VPLRAGKAKQPTAALWSESASRPQGLGKVLVTSQVKTSWTDTFSCYTGLSERGETATAVLEGQDLNLSLPILEQNPNGPGASPSASAFPSPSAAECYSPILPGSAVTKYNFPTSVATAETLENVNLTDDRVDSMFPPGQIGTSTVTWQGVSGLSPSMSATNLASAARQNKDAFWAGLLYGITAALAVPFLQCLPDAWKDTKAIHQALKAKAKDVQEHVEEERQEDPAVSSEPATGTT
jgi:hypothetical protein